ncbi:MAG TPA: hypothetical protein VLG11_03900 [Candidatus Saccharimonadales bacterium]|nr:hypothetical protein [Candidatus Saccharimonadales bacterium]
MNRIHETAAAAVTAAALMGGHEAQAAPREQPAQAEVAQQQARTLNLPQSVLGGPDVTERTSVNNGVETTVMDVTDTRPWASHFSQSPEASEKQTDAQRQVFTFGVDKLASEGKKIDSVSFEGFASDEAQDKAVDAPTAGLGVADAENVELANTRAHAVGAEDEQIIDNITGENVPVTYKPGVEVGRGDLAAKEVELAHQLHMTPDDLMQKFNTDPASLPMDVQNTLAPLVSDRHVVAEITATRELPITGVERPGDSGKPTPTGHDTPTVPVPGTHDTQDNTPQVNSNPAPQAEPSQPHHGVDQPAFTAENTPFINTPDAVLPPSTVVSPSNYGPAATAAKGIAGPQQVPAAFAGSHKQPRPYSYSGKSGSRSARTHGGNLNR